MIAALIKGIASGDNLGGPTALASILGESVSFNKNISNEDLIQRYSDWADSDAFDTGPTFALVFGYIRAGLSPSNASKQAHEILGGQTAGCSPSQRIAPLAGCPFIPTSKLAKLARKEARITHYHRFAGDAAAIVTLICRYLIEGQDFNQIDVCLSQNERNSWVNINGSKIGSGGSGPDAVRTAWHCLTRSEAPIAEAVRIAGSTNYAPPIVGAFLAAREIGRTPHGHFRTLVHS